jgi:hypothetical protein
MVKTMQRAFNPKPHLTTPTTHASKNQILRAFTSLYLFDKGMGFAPIVEREFLSKPIGNYSIKKVYNPCKMHRSHLAYSQRV